MWGVGVVGCLYRVYLFMLQVSDTKWWGNWWLATKKSFIAMLNQFIYIYYIYIIRWAFFPFTLLTLTIYFNLTQICSLHPTNMLEIIMCVILLESYLQYRDDSFWTLVSVKLGEWLPSFHPPDCSCWRPCVHVCGAREETGSYISEIWITAHSTQTCLRV